MSAQEKSSIGRYHAAYLQALKDRASTSNERKTAEKEAEAALKKVRDASDAADREVEQRRRELQHHAIHTIINRDLVDVLLPTHTRSTCDDDNLANYEGRCPRCTMLYALTHPASDLLDDYELSLEVTWKGRR